jgi:Ca2+-binding EF-hand superfamily protein
MRGLVIILALGVAGPAAAQPANVSGMDRDKDGRVSRIEYRAELVSGSMKFDKNNDGRVAKAELPGVARLPGAKGVVDRIYKMTDADGDGALSSAEFAARAETRFRELDTDRDGHLSQAEIKSAPRQR